MTTHSTPIPQVKRLERPSEDRLLAGVASGLGRYFDLSPNLFRLGLIALTLLSGAGILVYLAAVLVIPEQGKEQSHVERALAKRRDKPWSLALLGVFALIAAAILTSSGWILVPVAFLFILWTARGTKARTIAVVVTALIALLLGALATATIVAFSWFDVSLSDGTGKHVYEPSAITAVKPQYKLGIGELRVDLSHVGPVTKEQVVKASLGIGELRIIVPHNAAVTVNARVKVGDTYVFNQHDSGRNAKVHTGQGNPLVIDATVGAGRIDVVRAG